MIDRVPLEQVVKKEEPKPELNQRREEMAPDKTIDAIADLHDMSVMMGFEHGFDGNNPEFIYQWAKDVTGELGGPKVLSHIKNTIRLMGTTIKGPMLLRKLNLYAKLDSRQRQIQMRKENLI